MKLHIYDNNHAVLVCQKKNIKIVGIALIITGVIIDILTLPFTEPLAYPIVLICSLLFILPGIGIIFHKTLIIVDHSIGKVTRQTNVFGLYKWVRNVWDLTKISSLEKKFFKSQDEDSDSYDINLKFSDGNKIIIFQTYHEYNEVIDAFNLFIKGKNTAPGIID